MADSGTADPIDDPRALLLVDARNGFNEIGRIALLWTTRYRWAQGARFAFNCYRHQAQLVLRRPGRECAILASKEGVTQGDPLSMVLYGLALTPLAEWLLAAEPTLMQAWYADDSAMAGPASALGRVMDALVKFGPAYGYFPEPEKSVIIAEDAVRETVEATLARHRFRFAAGARYIGAFAGSREERLAWLAPQVDQWVYGVKRLAMVAKTRPQEAFAGLTCSLKSEWGYLQRVCPDLGNVFTPIEKTLRDDFLPAILGESDPIDDQLRRLLSLGTKAAGAGVRDPTKRAEAELNASRACNGALIASLILGRLWTSTFTSPS